MKLKKRTIKKLEKAGFSYSKDEDTGEHYFGKSSPAGQDFSFMLNDEADIRDLCQACKEYYDSFDVSYEAYIWLDNTGHGKVPLTYPQHQHIHEESPRGVRRQNPLQRHTRRP